MDGNNERLDMPITNFGSQNAWWWLVIFDGAKQTSPTWVNESFFSMEQKGKAADFFLDVFGFGIEPTIMAMGYVSGDKKWSDAFRPSALVERIFSEVNEEFDALSTGKKVLIVLWEVVTRPILFVFCITTLYLLSPAYFAIWVSESVKNAHGVIRAVVWVVFLVILPLYVPFFIVGVTAALLFYVVANAFIGTEREQTVNQNNLLSQEEGHFGDIEHHNDQAILTLMQVQEQAALELATRLSEQVSNPPPQDDLDLRNTRMKVASSIIKYLEGNEIDMKRANLISLAHDLKGEMSLDKVFITYAQEIWHLFAVANFPKDLLVLCNALSDDARNEFNEHDSFSPPDYSNSD